MKSLLYVGLLAGMGLGLYGCNDSQTAVTPDETTTLNSARVASDSAGFFCKRKLTSVAVADLPAAVTGYIATNYAGATVAYAAKDDAGAFFVGITQNGQAKALLFNADGTFNQEVELRRGGRGPHGKGPGGRGSLQQIAVSDLPAAITNHINATYAGAQIQTAARDSVRGYLVMILLNNVPKTLLYNTDGTFNREVEKMIRGNFTNVALTDLPAAVTSYVTTNYAGSTIRQAARNAEGQFVVWVQASSGPPVVLLFAADGRFIQVVRRRR